MELSLCIEEIAYSIYAILVVHAPTLFLGSVTPKLANSASIGLFVLSVSLTFPPLPASMLKYDAFWQRRGRSRPCPESEI